MLSERAWLLLIGLIADLAALLCALIVVLILFSAEAKADAPALPGGLPAAAPAFCGCGCEHAGAESSVREITIADVREALFHLAKSAVAVSWLNHDHAKTPHTAGLIVGARDGR